jgi:hypothetical protein
MTWVADGKPHSSSGRNHAGNYAESEGLAGCYRKPLLISSLQVWIVGASLYSHLPIGAPLSASNRWARARDTLITDWSIAICWRIGATA